MDLDPGTVAVVTGAARGIGRALATALHERGCRVVLADLDEDDARRAAAELGDRALGVGCDVRSRSDMERLADAAESRFGPVDLIANNAGVMPAATTGLLGAPAVDLEWVLAVNVVGTWNGCSVFGQRLVARDRPGWILNTASEHALGMQHTGQGFYTASKSAILGLSDVLRAELPAHVGLTVLCPGLSQSDLWSARHRPQALDVDALALLPIAKAVMGRGMPATEVARAALEGVQRGDPLVVTHHASRAAAERRCAQVTAAFDAQAPFDADGPDYDVNRTIGRVLEQGAF